MVPESTNLNVEPGPGISRRVLRSSRRILELDTVKIPSGVGMKGQGWAFILVS